MSVLKIKKNGVWENIGVGNGNVEVGSIIDIDATLTQSGKAADAKIVGDRIGELSGVVDEIVEYLEDNMEGNSEIPAYTEDDYGKVLSATASGLVWVRQSGTSVSDDTLPVEGVVF